MGNRQVKLWVLVYSEEFNKVTSSFEILRIPYDLNIITFKKKITTKNNTYHNKKPMNIRRPLDSHRDFTDAAIRLFIKGVLYNKFPNVEFESYNSLIQYIKEYNKDFKISKQSLSNLKNRPLLWIPVPKTKETERFVRYIQIKFPLFESSLIYKHFSTDVERENFIQPATKLLRRKNPTLIAILNRSHFILHKWLFFILFNYSEIILSLWILILMTNNIEIFLNNNLLLNSYIWSFEDNHLGGEFVGKDLLQDNNLLELSSPNSNLEQPTIVSVDLNSSEAATLSKPINNNMPWIKQLFGIFYFKDLIYVKSYFQPYTVPCIVDYNIISQSSTGNGSIIILKAQNSSYIGNILEGSGSRSSELLNRITACAGIFEQELSEANQNREIFNIRNVDLNEQLNDETYILKKKYMGLRI